MKIYVLLQPQKSFWNTEWLFQYEHNLPGEGKGWSSKAACSQEACQTMSWAGLSAGRCSEKLLSCLIFFVWTLSLCAVCHTAMLRFQWGMFSLSNSDSGCSFPHITHLSCTLASYLSLICTCFTFETHHNNMDPCFCQHLEDIFMPGLEQTISVGLTSIYSKKSKSKKGVLGEFIAR